MSRFIPDYTPRLKPGESFTCRSVVIKRTEDGLEINGQRHAVRLSFSPPGNTMSSITGLALLHDGQVLIFIGESISSRRLKVQEILAQYGLA